MEHEHTIAQTNYGVRMIADWEKDCANMKVVKVADLKIDFRRGEKSRFSFKRWVNGLIDDAVYWLAEKRGLYPGKQTALNSERDEHEVIR